jgi:hypothetical protein
MRYHAHLRFRYSRNFMEKLAGVYRKIFLLCHNPRGEITGG